MSRKAQKEEQHYLGAFLQVFPEEITVVDGARECPDFEVCDGEGHRS
jgi:hypothetical protein